MLLMLNAILATGKTRMKYDQDPQKWKVVSMKMFAWNCLELLGSSY